MNEITPRKKEISDWALFGFAAVLFFVIYGFGGGDANRAFAISYTVFCFLRYINNLGYTINIFDFLTFYSALMTLLAPLFSYLYFDKSMYLARITFWYMWVPEDEYFAYLIPGNLAFFAGLHFFFYKRTRLALEYMERAKAYVADKTRVGVVLVTVGVLASQFIRLVPDSITFIFYLLSMLTYVGGFYLYFSLKKRRNLMMTLLVLVFFGQSIQKGLFGEFAMYMVLASSLIMAQYRFRFFAKLAFILVAIFLFVMVQSIKGDFRQVVWRGGVTAQYRGKGSLEIFSDMLSTRISDPSTILNQDAMFELNRRLNQGWLIARTMDYVPKKAPFADGETIWKSLAAVAVPRFLWPDKPESGGFANLSRFVGIKRRLHYSMNIGPFGEGYGNFGPVGGVVFMLVYGLAFAIFLDQTLKRVWKTPSFIIWVPLLFFYVLNVETDILTTINSFVKSIVFVAVIYWGANRFFNTDV